VEEFKDNELVIVDVYNNIQDALDLIKDASAFVLASIESLEEDTTTPECLKMAKWLRTNILTPLDPSEEDVAGFSIAENLEQFLESLARYAQAKKYDLDFINDDEEEEINGTPKI